MRSRAEREGRASTWSSPFPSMRACETARGSTKRARARARGAIPPAVGVVVDAAPGAEGGVVPVDVRFRRIQGAPALRLRDLQQGHRRAVAASEKFYDDVYRDVRAVDDDRVRTPRARAVLYRRGRQLSRSRRAVCRGRDFARRPHGSVFSITATAQTRRRSAVPSTGSARRRRVPGDGFAWELATDSLGGTTVDSAATTRSRARALPRPWHFSAPLRRDASAGARRYVSFLKRAAARAARRSRTTAVFARLGRCLFAVLHACSKEGSEHWRRQRAPARESGAGDHFTALPRLPRSRGPRLI